MKEIRLCDDGKLDFTSEICKKNNTYGKITLIVRLMRGQ